jgi:hypothetical protein
LLQAQFMSQLRLGHCAGSAQFIEGHVLEHCGGPCRASGARPGRHLSL